LRPPSPAARRLFEALSESFDAAIATVRPGVTAHEVDRAARTVLERHELAQFFLHRTGHGIGLDVHENPNIVSGNHDVLAPGMTFSIEPGIYRPDFGARIEDIVVVTEHGCEQLNRQPRDLWVD
jgi:Xaa-Pro aminopeptidase